MEKDARCTEMIGLLAVTGPTVSSPTDQDMREIVKEDCNKGEAASD